MIACVQRCTRAEVRVAERSIGSIGRGLLVLLGVEKGDDQARADRLAARLLELRVFEDSEGKLNRSARETGAELLVVSQFTLVARLDRGRRPSFDRAAPPTEANALYERIVEHLRSSGLRVATGSFGARMEVELVNDGPVTFLVEER
jgi:D-tyrosyl-tRNA(Tyr) deacylase